jgi:hypothetical protein
MILEEMRFVERWERLGNIEAVTWKFLWCVALSAACLWLVLEYIPGSDMCRYRGRMRTSGVCSLGFFSVISVFALMSAFMALKIAVDLCVKFWRPLPRRAISPVLRALVLLKRMHLEKVTKGDALEFSFTTLGANFKPYRALTLKIKGMHRFIFYRGDHCDVSPSSIFQEGALLEFSYLADSTGLDYARVNVRCEHQGQVFRGELELEADSYELRLLPKSVLEKRQ